MLERLWLTMRLREDGIPANHGVASSIARIGTGEIRNRLGATTQLAGRPYSSTADRRLSKFACGARVSVTMIHPSARYHRATKPSRGPEQSEGRRNAVLAAPDR